MQKIKIGITDCSKFPNYKAWIEAEPGVEVIKLSHHDNNLQDVNQCEGIVISGGEDVHPRFYNKLEYLPYCHEIDEKRDEFELRVIDYAEKNNLPLLGICRGLQVANVYYGGTLVPDLPSFGKFNHSRYTDRDRYHQVMVDDASELKKITGTSTGEINSAHHQSAELIGKGLVTNAVSPEGVVEGIERKDARGRAFFQLVQWHPERMTDLKSAFSQKIKEAFVSAIRK